MSRTRTLFFALAAASLWSCAAMAQETTTYTLEKTDNGYVRMNNKTGEMSICQEKSGQLICKLAAEERAAYEEDIADLKTRVAKLEETVASMGKIPPVVRDALPSDEEFEKGLSYMEKFMRRFMGIAREFGNDNKDTKPEQPTPQKT
ncbi:hypothetical protein [Phyllobacterium zundukense]|uniref:Uncharacterized protein n=1 Tax=Phyllobacterium zundukense TaxID=1867719 RepID=A0A2N9VS89_9HYPH|nr:hypothetical protein [Phyllobacterium zundukense]ATU92779.1 hypothetical protein BLM14_14945 [Phyllobacterium zundukense]PIO42357.1 hypothetical protein B5P45_25400 [Phyllobacterium zundukense]